MKDDNNKKNPNLIDKEREELEQEDRFTTQDIAEIDELIKDNKASSKSHQSQVSSSNASSEKTQEMPQNISDLGKDDVKPIAEEIRAARERGQISDSDLELVDQDSKPKNSSQEKTQKLETNSELKSDENSKEEGLKNKISNWILGGDSNHDEEVLEAEKDTSEPEVKDTEIKKTSSQTSKEKKVAATPETSRSWLKDRQKSAKEPQNRGASRRVSKPRNKNQQTRRGIKAAPAQKIIGNTKRKHSRGLPKKHPKRPWAKTLLICLIIVAILGAIGATGVYLLYTANFTDISDTEYTPKEKTVIYTSDNVQIASLFAQNRSYVSIEQVPADLKNALVATEDSRFYTHNGVDYRGVARALLSNILGGNSTGQGASTITQQLARLLYLPNIATESTFMDSLNRKFKEISISYQLEDKYTKDQILEMYLNEYFFGSAAYGIEAASETYFGKTVDQLNLAESAMLAGLPQAPSVYAPNVNFEAAKQRQKQVLERMVDTGYINQQQADEAYNTPINVIPWSEQSLNNQIAPGYKNFVSQVLDEYAKAVAPSIMRERGLNQDEAESYARQNVASGGYKFYTTINSKMQQDAIGVMENYLASFGFDQESGYTGTLVTVDRSSAVRSYYGGNEEISDIDMASRARQPGSNIKPLYYAMALEKGIFQPDSVLNDAPININGYTPTNSGGGYSGPITFSQSLIQSKNVTSVQIFNAIGVQGAVDWLKSFGLDTITDDDYNLASALGGFTYGVRPYQLAAAFNTFNDGGVYNQAYFIDRVTTTAGETVLDKNGLGLVSKQMISPQTAQAMWNIMQGVVTGGTGTNAQNALPTAGKTGTTDTQENLWFTGMTGNLTTSIWLGNLDYYVLGGGSYLPASIYGGYMNTLIGQGLVS